MDVHAITVGGIPIPSRDPWFLATVAIHVAAGIVAVVAGAVAMRSAKGPGRHPRTGTVYFWSLTVVAATMALLAAARWPQDNHLAALGALAFGSATLGRTARRARWRRWMPVHITAMGVSYVAMLTAFYVDNGPHLPLWNRLSTLAFWLLPALIGAPIIVAALRRGRPELLARHTP
ncbi:MAG TPA: hypothetical protein VFI52_01605 [Gemmatimonadaceae bacterium]|nr:hypothetical protein [Gemmatimonadaceae bacterium]